MIDRPRRFTENKPKLEELLRGDQLMRLVDHGYKTSQVWYISNVLSPGEVDVIRNNEDILYVARAKRKTDEELDRYDQFTWTTKVNRAKYMREQRDWLNTEKYLLGLQQQRDPSPGDLAGDFIARQLGQFYRAFYVIKYPERMRKK